MKLGIIRCMQTEDYCPGSRDFRTIRERKGAFMGEDDIQLVGFINCGAFGGPLTAAMELVLRGLCRVVQFPFALVEYYFF